MINSIMFIFYYLKFQKIYTFQINKQKEVIR